VAYREDLEAALARADALAEELAEEKRRHEADVAALQAEIAVLRAKRKKPKPASPAPVPRPIELPDPGRVRDPSDLDEAERVSLHAKRRERAPESLGARVLVAIVLAAVVGALVFWFSHVR
jgi:hypothetical protein